SRALYLEQKFTNLRLDNFSNVSDYCQELKVLADQLSNIGSPVSNDRLVLQLVAGLNESYDSVASHLQHTDPLPQFYEARSRLILEETRKEKQAATNATTAGSALLTTTSCQNKPSDSLTNRWFKTFLPIQMYGSFNNTITPGGRAGRSQNKWSRSCDVIECREQQKPTEVTIWTTHNHGLFWPWNLATSGRGTPPPCPSYFLTRLGLQPKNGTNLVSRPKTTKSYYKRIRLYFDSTMDNNISLEFDPFGFTVKEFPKGIPLMRRNSSGDLYPLSTTMLRQLTSPSTFAALSQDLWHHRLGHLGARILNSLRNKRYIQCNRTSRTSVYQSCFLGKQIKMPFYDSSSSTLLPSDIIHSDLWTSPILSSAGHRYYVLFLDAYSNFLPFHISQTTQTPKPPTAPVRTIHTRSMSGITKLKIPFNFSASTTLSPIPQNPKDALSDTNWSHAMTDEFNALIDNNTWVLVPRTPDMHVIRSMWIFRHKMKSGSSFERYKARLVGDGRSQQLGVDCNETFSPVVKPATIQMVLSIALSKSWSIHQLDVKNAFLHGTLNEIVYMHQPFVFRDPHYPNHVICSALNVSSLLNKRCPIHAASTWAIEFSGCDNLSRGHRKRTPIFLDQVRSSAEAEYRGVVNVVSDSCWIRKLLLELHCPIPKATLVFCDNVSVIFLCGNPVQHQCTKHIEKDIHFVREKVARGEVRVLHAPSRYQIADVFTKGLPRVLFDDFRDSLSVRPPPDATVWVY
ncbi:ribonuclease H-like domain-containing protein, partial [Tanacetum coccineum]